MGRSYFVPAAGRKHESMIPDWEYSRSMSAENCRPLCGRVNLGNCNRVSIVRRSRNGMLHTEVGLFSLVRRADGLASGPRERALPPAIGAIVKLAYWPAGVPLCKGGLNGGCYTTPKACSCQCRDHATYSHGCIAEGSNEASMELSSFM